MYKRIFKSIVYMVVMTSLLTMCTKSNKDIVSFKSKVDLTETSVAADATSSDLWYSTDGGATFVQFPNLRVGQSYQVKVKDNNINDFLTSSYGLALDWSSSNPKPSDASADAPTFTLSASSNVSVKMTGTLDCPLMPANFTGTWIGVEGHVTSNSSGNFTGSNDTMIFTQDSSDPNKIWVTNLFGDGANIVFYFTMNADKTITVPAQTTGDPGSLAATTGSFITTNNAATGCVAVLGSMPISYTAFGDTFVWTYTFHR